MPPFNLPPNTPRQVASDADWEGIDSGEYRFAPGVDTFGDENPNLEDTANDVEPRGVGLSN